MPFVSQAQRGFMYAKHPKLAAEFESKTPKGAKLPQHVSAFHAAATARAGHGKSRKTHHSKGGKCK